MDGREKSALPRGSSVFEKVPEADIRATYAVRRRLFLDARGLEHLQEIALTALFVNLRGLTTVDVVARRALIRYAVLGLYFDYNLFTFFDVEVFTDRCRAETDGVVGRNRGQVVGAACCHFNPVY